MKRLSFGVPCPAFGSLMENISQTAHTLESPCHLGELTTLMPGPAVERPHVRFRVEACALNFSKQVVSEKGKHISSGIPLVS